MLFLANTGQIVMYYNYQRLNPCNGMFEGHTGPCPLLVGVGGVTLGPGGMCWLGVSGAGTVPSVTSAFLPPSLCALFGDVNCTGVALSTRMLKLRNFIPTTGLAVPCYTSSCSLHFQENSSPRVGESSRKVIAHVVTRRVPSVAFSSSLPTKTPTANVLQPLYWPPRRRSTRCRVDSFWML